MKKLKNVWAIVDNNASGEELTRLAAMLGGDATIVTCKDEVFFLNSIPSIIAKVEEAKPDAVICATTKNGRLISGILAARLDTVVLSDLSEICVEDGISGKRIVYGGAALREETVSGTAILCLGNGLLAEESAEADIHVLELCDESNSFVLLDKRKKEVKSVNLAGAKRIVSAGRGVGSEELLGVLMKLAGVLEAEVGCTRPVSEENGWLPTERYIGVSGVITKPDFYLAVGVSGQIQHMVGCCEAGTVFAINKQKDAPIFNQCDYGLVGDVNVIIPALLEALRQN